MPLGATTECKLQRLTITVPDRKSADPTPARGKVRSPNSRSATPPVFVPRARRIATRHFAFSRASRLSGKPGTLNVGVASAAGRRPKPSTGVHRPEGQHAQASSRRASSTFEAEAGKWMRPLRRFRWPKPQVVRRAPVV